MSIAEKLQNIAENEQRVYAAGYAKGQAEGGDTTAAYNEGFEAGKQAEYDTLWDNLQANGERIDYRSFYAGTTFTHIDPKYIVKASNADSIFSGNRSVETANWEKFDLTTPSSLYNAFGYCVKLQSVDADLAVSARTPTLLNSIFRCCYALVRVKKITAYPEAVWKNSFDECYELVDITFDGTIGSNGLSFKDSTKLSRASFESIVRAYSTTIEGLSCTFSKEAKEAAFTDEEWEALRAERPNVTFYFV